MEITINQDYYQMQENCSVEQMLSVMLTTEPKGIAVSVNQHIMPKSQWAQCILQQGDQVTIIKATQGG